MSKEFKVGDKVRALEDSFSGDFLKGGIYEVSLIYEKEGYTRIKVVADSDGSPNGWLADNFELVDSFDDLIDVVVKAYKNRLLDIFLMNDEVITVFNHDATGTKEGINRADTSKYYQFIEFINSLYTETFVIESEEDMSKFNNAIDSIILANGEDIIDIVMFNRNKPYFTNGGVGAVKVPFAVLKGATVTQKRGNK